MPRQTLGKLVDHLIDHLDEACLGIDKEGRIQFANPSACAVFGLAAEQVRGQKVWDAVQAPEFTRTFVRLIKESGAEGREQVMVLPDQRAYLVQTSAVRGPDGRLSGAVAVLRDMSSITQIEHDVTTFVGRISQELKKPLTAIKGYVETLLEGAYADPAISRRFLQVINDETNRMARLLVGLLDAGALPSRPAAARPVDLGAVVRTAAEKLSPFAHQKSIEVALQVPEPLPPVRGDEALFGQMVTNLLDNALKFSGLLQPPARGRVGVTVRMDGDTLLLEVRDNGVGIAPAEHERIFERFYRVAEGPAAALGGTGLGLSIARDIAHGAGGTITVESALGRGSTFVVRLPAAGRS